MLLLPFYTHHRLKRLSAAERACFFSDNITIRASRKAISAQKNAYILYSFKLSEPRFNHHRAAS